MKKWESVTTKTIKAFPDGKHCHNNKKKKNRMKYEIEIKDKKQ